VKSLLLDCYCAATQHAAPSVVTSLDMARIIPSTRGFPLPGDPHKENEPMKRAFRVLILMVGLFCTYTALTVPTVAVAEDGAPTPGHPPK